MTINKRPIGEIIANRLKERQMKQKDLALMVGLPAPMISEYINGVRKVSPKSCIAIGLALGFEPYELGRMQSDYYILQAFKEVMAKTKES